MVAYNFKPQFRPPILAGTKAQTIRAERKRHARPGEQVQLYTGLRTRQCRIIGTATCKDVVPVRIGVRDGFVDYGRGVWNLPARLRDFARLDGFSDWPAMVTFWRREHPDVEVFSGVLIHWSHFTAAAATGPSLSTKDA